MYCPNCATQNADGSKFCRSCGANIVLVPMAMSGQLDTKPITTETEELPQAIGRCRPGRQRSGEDGIKSIFIGIGFLFVAIALAFNHASWWFWILIPAFATMGGGVAEYLKSRRRVAVVSGQAVGASTPLEQPLYSAPALPRATNELNPQPPSITEGTTRHLVVEKVRAPYDHSS